MLLICCRPSCATRARISADGYSPCETVRCPHLQDRCGSGASYVNSSGSCQAACGRSNVVKDAASSPKAVVGQPCIPPIWFHILVARGRSPCFLIVGTASAWLRSSRPVLICDMRQGHRPPVHPIAPARLWRCIPCTHWSMTLSLPVTPVGARAAPRPPGDRDRHWGMRGLDPMQDSGRWDSPRGIRLHPP